MYFSSSILRQKGIPPLCSKQVVQILTLFCILFLPLVAIGQESDCFDGIDNDLDGATDCEDLDCEFSFKLIDSGQLLGSSTSASVALGHLNDDEYLDAVVVGAGPNRVYFNDGEGVFKFDYFLALPPGPLLPVQGYSTSVALADFNGDMRLDAFVTNSGHHDLVYMNVDGKLLPSTQFYDDVDSKSSCVALNYINDDGFIDAFVANFDIGEPNRIYLGVGDGRFILSPWQPEGAYRCMGVALGDLDNDGHCDAFLANNGENRVLLNAGGLYGGPPGKLIDSGQALGSSMSLNVALADLDGDADLDAFVVNANQRSRIYKNNEGEPLGIPGQFSLLQTFHGNPAASSVALADIDGDGDTDAYVATRGSKDGNCVHLNNGDWDFQSIPQKYTNTATLSGCAVLGDVDGDGDLDVFECYGGNKGDRVWINESCNTAVPVPPPGGGCLQEKEHLLAESGGTSNYPATVRSIAVDGEFMVTGVIHGDTGTGAAYVYRRDPLTGLFGPEPMQQLTGNDADGFDWTGCSVAIDGHVIVVGSMMDSYQSTWDAGSAYVFRLVTLNGVGLWLEEQVLTPPVPVLWGHFGVDVAISGETIAVGARGMGNSQNGMAFIFRYETDPLSPSVPGSWVLKQELIQQSPTNATDSFFDEFGSSVSLSPDVLAIGAWRYETNATKGAGQVFVYERDPSGTWALTANMHPAVVSLHEGIGMSVDNSDNEIVIGSNQGKAYIFERDQTNGLWPDVETQVLIHPGDGKFGSGVGLDENNLVICSDYDDLAGPYGVSAFLFRKDLSGPLGAQWKEVGQLCSSIVTSDYNFGHSVSISGSTVAIVSSLEENPGNAKGSTWVFELEPGQPAECSAEVIDAWCSGFDSISALVRVTNPYSTEVNRIALPTPRQFPGGGVVSYSPDEIVIDPAISNGQSVDVVVTVFSNMQMDVPLIPMALLNYNGVGNAELVCDPLATFDISTVEDTNFPIFECPSDKIVEIEGSLCCDWWNMPITAGFMPPSGQLPDFTGIEVSDCSEVQLTQSPPPGISYAVGDVVEVILSAEDSGGNISTCSFTVTFLMESGPWDCNDNGFIDSWEISSNADLDQNDNGILDECEGG